MERVSVYGMECVCEREWVCTWWDANSLKEVGYWEGAITNWTRIPPGADKSVSQILPTLLIVVSPLQHDLWCPPVSCHDVARHLVSHRSTETKVKDLNLTVFTHSNVARLQVLWKEDTKAKGELLTWYNGIFLLLTLLEQLNNALSMCLHARNCFTIVCDWDLTQLKISQWSTKASELTLCMGIGTQLWHTNN